MARPRIEIDWSDVEKLCALQATEEEVAQFLGCSVDTLARRCQEDHDLSFAEYFAQKRGMGKVSLRRAQWQTAQKGNATMQIWLGKQYLGQKDKSEHQHSGPDGQAIEIRALSERPTEELQAKYAELLAKAQTLESPKGGS